MGKNTQQMQFTLRGFTQDAGYRVFAYEGVGDDRIRMKFTVRTDLALSRQYGIRLQELPLMCLAILEAGSPSLHSTETALTFTEEAMIRYAEECVAAREAAALKKSATRRQPAKPEEESAASDPYATMAMPPPKPFGPNW